MSLLAFVVSISLLFTNGVMSHAITKRKAAENKLYVYANRTGCVEVKSMGPCHVNWKLTSFNAVQYEAANKVVSTYEKALMDARVGNICIEKYRKLACSQRTPKCLEDGGSDYGDANKMCQAVLDSCPKDLTDAFKQEKTCEKIRSGNKGLSECVVAPEIQGSCPQPKYKVPADTVQTYSDLSIELTNTVNSLKRSRHPDGRRLYTDECLVKYEDIVCTPIYCSEDGERFLVEHDREDCESIMNNCFLNALLSLPSSYDHIVQNMRDFIEVACLPYPVADKTRQEDAPPTVLSTVPPTVLSTVPITIPITMPLTMPLTLPLTALSTIPPTSAASYQTLSTVLRPCILFFVLTFVAV